MFFFMPWAVFATHSNPQAYFAKIFSGPTIPTAIGHAAPLVSVNTVMSAAEVIWKGGRAERIRITNPGDASATIILDRHINGLIAGPDASLTFNGVTGALIPPTSESNTANTTGAAIFNLHEAHFARPALRWLLFLSGAVGTTMVASGLILWTEKRRRKRLDPNYSRRGFQVVDTFNVAVIAGYPAATAALFWSNRLLPLSLASRGNDEILCAFGCWGLLLVWSALRSTRKAWVEVLGVTAFLFLLLPVVNASTSSRGTLANLMRGDPLYVGFDLVSLALGLVFATAALSARRHTSLQTPPNFSDSISEAAQPILEGVD